MAALIRHGLLANPFKSTSAALLAVNTASLRHTSARLKSKKPVKRTYRRLEAAQESIASRGFLRPCKEYVPPMDVSSRIDTICNSQSISTADQTKLEDPLIRFNLFVACEQQLNHSVPNSLLCDIETIGDLKKFYETPVDTKTPLEALERLDLPKNLHVRQEYIRFHPDTDTMFGGKTAFPKSSTIVTGLKYKKKYPGHKQADPWIDEMLQINP